MARLISHSEESVSMSNSGHRFTALVLALAAATCALPVSAAGEAKATAAQHWSAWGGTVGVRWNADLAGDLGLRIAVAGGRLQGLSDQEHERFELRQGGTLDFNVAGGNLRNFVGGGLQSRGGYVLDSAAAGRIDLSDFRLVPRAPAVGAPPILDLVSSDGKAWFYVDRLMYEMVNNRSQLAVRTMDLRITPELARRLGKPEAADWVIADMELTTDVVRQGTAEPQGTYVPRWHGNAVPGVPGATYQADLFMQTFSMQYSRCNGCTGEGGSGSVVFTPSSTLRNNVNNGTLAVTVAGDPQGTSSVPYAADIPWYAKFSGNFPPYGNDQHPYLIWNLYRLNADGSIEQIGRSGVKHAFLTLNTSCSEDPGDSHILGRGCSDVYSVSNNDANNSLGPRSEIIPATNEWGRCGSIYDTNCDGLSNASGNTNFSQRLVVTESQFSGPAQAGATYLFESWYLARQDQNIFNSMGTTRATFTRSNGLWVVGGNDQYKLGPAIDRWVDPASPGPNATSVKFSSAEGTVKVAVRAFNLGNGSWRYEYAVMNLDFARAVTEGAEPNLRVISNRGLSSFSLPIGSATVTDLKFGDGDLNAGNDWTPAIVAQRVTWTAPASNPLNWGTLYRFSFVANQGPRKNTATLNVATAGSPGALKLSGVLAPALRTVLGP
jgi:hypothetical protein